MADTLTFHTSSPEETMALGERIGRALMAGTVVALFGEMGAGKTTITKGIACGLEVDDLVHSPTFTLIHEHDGRIPVYHFDLYRLDFPEQLEDLGYQEYFYGEGVSILEWPEKIESLLPADRLEIHITAHDGERGIEIRATGEHSAASLAGIRA